MLVCMTFALATNGLAGQMMWIEHRDVEGGPYQQFLDTASDWENVTGTAFDQFGNFLGDLLLSALPGSSFFATQALNFGIPWIALTCSLNIVLTILISYRLITARRYIRLSGARSLQASDLVRMYTGPVAIFVESALPFSILGIIFAILLGKGITVYVIFSAVWGSYVGIAPLLIIHRMASGKAWSRNTAYQMSTINDNLTEEPPIEG
ncbi:hypothetical protein V5O48_019261, partial [Marasmius crinis-equi]